jgi:cysteinyl-tRNA synthetase
MADGFRHCMDDDINTSGALGHFFEAVTEANKFLDQNPRRTPSGTAAIEALAALFCNLGGVLGILQQDPKAFAAELQARGAEGAGITETRILELIAQRAEAKKNKDFKRADAIRDELLGKGIVLKDGPAGTAWESKG